MPLKCSFIMFKCSTQNVSIHTYVFVHVCDGCIDSISQQLIAIYCVKFHPFLVFFILNGLLFFYWSFHYIVVVACVGYMFEPFLHRYTRNAFQNKWSTQEACVSRIAIFSVSLSGPLCMSRVY